ncbi:hypothetical protein LB507_010723 [Fusarium sp. FIESC RH6]|nr:hypothetical protein LB507_010723 [Fusarium sp. FIESC RH6]
MEQQDLDIPCTPTARVTEHRSTLQSPSSSPSTSSLTPAPQRYATTPSSRPTTPATVGSTVNLPRNPLSTSEPTLRFPRPQGNRHLANWISSSNPDIMRFTTTTEDSGLMSESEYEVISNDTESQDGNYTESMGESIGSLGLSRPDDVQSHTGTEQTYDDESVTDECDIPSQQTHQEEPDDIVDSMDTEQTPQIQQSWASVVKNGPLPEVEVEPEVEPEAQPEPSAEQEPESEDEARSRSSLEYTQQSLKTPSIPSPDASITEHKPDQMLLPTGNEEEAETRRSALNKWLKETQHPVSKNRETIIKKVTSPSTVSAVLLLVLVSLISVFLTPLSRDAAPHIPAATSAVTNHPTLINSSSRSSLPTSQALTTSIGGSGLIPVQDAPANDWPWSSQKINVTVERYEGNFLLRMPRDVKKSWLDRDCLNFNAKRGGEHVRFGTSSTDEGIVLKIPKEEAHGMVKVDMYTTCRPRIHKVLRVTFEKGIISEALDLTWSFAQRVPELVPAAAQKAERRLEEARRSLETASCNFKTTSGTFCKDLGVKFHDAHRSLGWIKKDIKCRSQAAKHGISAKLGSIAADVKQYIPSTEAVQNRAELELLNAQITAKLWWLKLTAGDEEHDRYERAAEQFMTKKVIKQLIKNEYGRQSAAKAPASAKLCRFWLWSDDFKDRAERQKA